MFQQRPYQIECEGAILENYREGENAQLAVMATGTGKTEIFARAPLWIPKKRSLFLAHTEELIDQAANKIALRNPGLRVGIEMAERSVGADADAIVASVATLGRENSQRLANLNPDQFGVVTVDEAHHSVGSTYKRVLSHFGFGLTERVPDNRLLLGLTATDRRGDGVGLHTIFNKLVYRYTFLQAIRDGWLAPPVGFRVKTGTDISFVSSIAGDLNQAELSGAVNTKARNKLVVRAWQKMAQSRQTLGFTVDIQHAKDLAKAFNDEGIAAEAIWGTDPDREAKLIRHKERVTTVILNCGVLIEGYDDWQIGCVLLTGPTMSQLRFVQWVGRGSRLQQCHIRGGCGACHWCVGGGNLLEALAKGITTEKKDFYVIDFQDNTDKHKLITLPSLFGLPPNIKHDGEDILGLIEEMQELEKENPTVDFSALEEVRNASAYIEQVDLFTEKVDPVIAALSGWKWVLNAAGDYVLNLSNQDLVTLSLNELGHWEIHGSTSGTEFEDSNRELEQSVSSAESLIKRFWKGRASTLKRVAPPPGYNIPASSEQLDRIIRLSELNNKDIPDISGLSFYDAQSLINNMRR